MLVSCVVGTEVGQKVTSKCGNHRKVICFQEIALLLLLFVTPLVLNRNGNQWKASQQVL